MTGSGWWPSAWGLFSWATCLLVSFWIGSMMPDCEDEPQWVVSMIDVGCDCCSYVTVASFDSRPKAEKYVARKGDPSNYMIEEF